MYSGAPTPHDIISKAIRPSKWDGWVPTYSGKGYRPFSMDPGSLPPEDIAWGLSHTFRYGGMSDPVITVAEHSVLVATIIGILWPNCGQEGAGLLHDSSESVLHDIQSPLRKKIMVTLADGSSIPWEENDQRITTCIARDYGVSSEDLKSPEVRAADILAASFEKRDCFNLGDEDWGLPPIPKSIQGLRILGQSPAVARGCFREVMQQLGLKYSQEYSG